MVVGLIYGYALSNHHHNVLVSDTVVGLDVPDISLYNQVNDLRKVGDSSPVISVSSVNKTESHDTEIKKIKQH